jgi:hypothetical protein
MVALVLLLRLTVLLLPVLAVAVAATLQVLPDIPPAVAVLVAVELVRLI